jgi:PleD family two-component response regulator
LGGHAAGARLMQTNHAMLDSAGAGRHPAVLIASHQESSSRSLESILGPNGYTVLKAYTGAQTLERARRSQPDAVILDATLPDQDPLEICHTLRHDPEFAPDTPIIIVSSDHATRQQRIDALRAGAWEYLGQPLDAEHLLLKLETFTRVKLGADRAREDGLVDQATGLYNLRGLARRARELGAQASRLSAALACVALAPDFGDGTPGGEPTDEALEAVVAQLAGAFRAAGRVSDAFGRLGPTEFAVVASGTDAAGAVRLAERLATAATAGPRDSLGAQTAAPFKLRAGYYVVSDARLPSTDPADTILGAASALRLARAEAAGPWIRAFPVDPGRGRVGARQSDTL